MEHCGCASGIASAARVSASRVLQYSACGVSTLSFSRDSSASQFRRRCFSRQVLTIETEAGSNVTSTKTPAEVRCGTWTTQCTASKEDSVIALRLPTQ